MQLQREARTGANTVTRYDAHSVSVNDITYTHPVYFRPEGAIQRWTVNDFASIDLSDIETAAGLQRQSASMMDFLDDNPTVQYHNAPAVLIIGTGQHQRFLSPALLAPLLGARIGVEVMSTPAAARTYNILMSEGRNVAVALWIDPT